MDKMLFVIVHSDNYVYSQMAIGISVSKTVDQNKIYGDFYTLLNYIYIRMHMQLIKVNIDKFIKLAKCM